MKKIIPYSLFILFILTALAAKAQNTDSLYRAKKEKDSVYRAWRKDYEAKDSIYHFDRIKKKLVNKDSLHKDYKLSDSIIRKVYKDHRSKDTIYRTYDIKRKVLMDSLHYKKFADSTQRKLFSERKKLFVSKKITDSLYRKKTLHVLSDSLHRLTKFKRLQSDSLRKLYPLDGRMDSLHRKYKLANGMRLDSMKRNLFLRNIKADSVRLKKYLQHKKIYLQKFQDTITLKEGYRSRDLSMEISCFEGDTVYINNNYKKVIIKIVPQQRLRLSTAIIYKEPMNDRDAIILNRMGIEFDRTATSVTTNIKNTKDNDHKSKLLQNEMTEAVYNELNSEANIKRTLFIEVPGNALLFLNTRYTETCVENYVKHINAEINNGSLKMGNADNVVLKTKYSTIEVDDIKKADLNFSNTLFTAGNIADMKIVSAASTVQLNNCSTMNMSSVRDEYRVTKAGSIAGNKDFGKFNIETLQDRLELKGANADLKIKNFSYEAPFIKIDSKYADLKLPLYEQKNYSLNYEGSYGDINKLSAVAEKLNRMGAIKTASPVQNDTVAVAGSQRGAQKTKYEATAGDITGKHAKVDIVCPYCNVVFN
jgi:hypothetical protein